MRIAVLGGTGFMGYDFVRLLLEEGRYRPVVYSTSAASMTNLARHEVDLRLIGNAELANLELEADVAAIVNFAHPFGWRDGVSPRRQLQHLCTSLERNLGNHPDRKLIHISTMSVYEPFAGPGYHDESHRLRPPRSDTYAGTKWRLEKRLSALEQAANRVLILRPTVVYGPFCRPWTDNLLAAFQAGSVGYCNLDGRMQPLYVGDVSRFLRHRLDDFRAGVFNIAGQHTVTWREFLEYFMRLVDCGPLERVSGADAKGIRVDLRTLAANVMADPAFRQLAKALLSAAPDWAEIAVRRKVSASDFRSLRRQPTGGGHSDQFCAPFFAKDRLVSMEKFRSQFADFAFQTMDDVRAKMSEYYRYRFSDDRFV